MQLNKNCVFCNSIAVHTQNQQEDSEYVNCPACGKYKIMDFGYGTFIDKEIKHKVASYLFYNKTDGTIFLFPEQIKERPQDFRTVDRVDIENWYPKTFAEKIDKILLFLSQLSNFEGDTFLVKHTLLSSLFFLKTPTDNLQSDAQLCFFREFLSDAEFVAYKVYIDNNPRHVVSKESGLEFKILPKGYEKIYELQKTQSANKKVFIACWFKKENGVKVIVENLKSIVKECGYEPNPICDKFHNNWIMPEIMREIKDSKFVIADLTGHRGGVYYEAGYADALGKQVILTCQASDDVHFDLEQRNLIRWKDYDELRSKLISHINGMKGLGIL